MASNGSQSYASDEEFSNLIQELENLKRPIVAEYQETANITLCDLFDVEQLQRIQDSFAKATNVASIITHPDGVPVTKPSNFCRLCNVIRKTEKGRTNCFCSDAVIGQQNPEGPNIRPCLSGGLWDAGASISVGGKHIGNWLLGQVKNELISEENLFRYASEIGANEEEFRRELQAVPIMSIEHFRDIANLGFILANELSREAYQNLQQSRHIAERKSAEIALRDSRNRLKLLLEINNAVVSKLELSHLVRLIPSRVREAMLCDSVNLSMPDAEAASFTVKGLDFPESNGFLREGMILDMQGSGTGIAYTTGKPFCSDGHLDGQNPVVAEINAGEGFRSECFIPVMVAEQKLAVLYLCDRRPGRFSSQDVEFLMQAANQIAIALENALKYRQLRQSRERLVEENLYLVKEIRADQQFDEIIGISPALRRVLGHVALVAGTDSTVLISGETGTGKELIARAIHDRSTRHNHMFVKVNCAAIPSGLLESELFGHEKGAFTGAIARKIGRFEVANGGTLFLDEIGDIPLELQPKLLRVLQEQEFERLGGTASIRVNVRVVSATNRDLEQMMREGQFRPDLFYRLNVFPIHLPPLRERPDDISLLVRHFVAKCSRTMNRQIEEIPDTVMEALVRYNWPGNVRELVNLIQRAVILSPGKALISPFAELNGLKEKTEEAKPQPTPPSQRNLFEMERDHIQKTLEETGWILGGSRGAAARLGIPRTTLIYKMRRLGIPRQEPCRGIAKKNSHS